MIANISISIERLLLTFWVGGFWTVGYLAVPVLFHSLPDKHLAADLAGQLFTAIHVTGLLCGGILLATVIFYQRLALLRQWRNWVLIGMLFMLLLGLYVLQPLMADIKLQSEWRQHAELADRFAILHGVASLLYLLTSLLGLVLVMAGLRQPSTHHP